MVAVPHQCPLGRPVDSDSSIALMVLARRVRKEVGTMLYRTLGAAHVPW